MFTSEILSINANTTDNKLFITINYKWKKMHNCDIIIEIKKGIIDKFEEINSKYILNLTEINSKTIFTNLHLYFFENYVDDQLNMITNYLDNCDLLKSYQ